MSTRHRTVYGAARGARQSRLSIAEVIRTAACPRCRAHIGESCTKVNGEASKSQHRQRWIVARKVAGI